MNNKFKEKIKLLIKKVYQDRKKTNEASLPYDELIKFPELKQIIKDLLTSDFDKFLESIDWIAPRPTTFRINLLNGQNFNLIYTEKSWIAEVEGKRYYLSNLDEEERASLSISRILSYGAKEVKKDEGENIEGNIENKDIEDIETDSTGQELN